jgi:hypothetical protein
MVGWIYRYAGVGEWRLDPSGASVELGGGRFYGAAVVNRDS